MDDYLILVAGAAAAGAAIMFGIMVFAGYLRRRSLRRKNEQRERVMTSVEEKWTDVDSLVAGYRLGRIAGDDFRKGLADKIEVINRVYKPSLHKLDIFFVKYTEKLIEEYTRMIESAAAGIARQGSAQAEALSGVEEEDEKEAATVVSGVIGEEEPAEQAAFQAGTTAQETGEEEATTMAAGQEDDLPLETFLEMETGTGSMSELAEAAEVPAQEETLEGVEAVNAVQAVQAPEQEEKGPATPAAPALPAIAKAPVAAKKGKTEEEPEATQTGPMPDFAFAEKAPAAEEEPAVAAVVEEKGEDADEETMAEAAVQIPVRVPVMPPPQPAFKGEEETVQQPATIYDIEAETIIADRNELLGVNKKPEPQPEKSSLGITGDDVSDMLDQFFGGGKR